MKQLLTTLILSTAALYAQSEECYNPNTGEDCGQCYVTGKSCQSGAGHGCPYPSCEWCQKIVRTEFCGVFLLAPACWCPALNTADCSKTQATPAAILVRQKEKNRLALKGGYYGFTLGYLSRYRSSKRTS